VAGVVGRESGEVYLEVVPSASRPNLERVVQDNTAASCTAYTDEWPAYDRLPGLGRGHATVCHAPGRREWARDDDGDGIRAGLRNFLRPFRGVSKFYLNQYTAMFQCSHNLKAVTDDFLRTLLGEPLGTEFAP
jgi:transposase-like protein